MHACHRRHLLCVVLLMLPSAARGEDWPMFGRDRNRNAVSPEKDPPIWWQIPQEDPKVQAKNIKWRAHLGTFTKGDPIVANGLVWVGTNNSQPRDPKVKEKAAVLMCFREKDGKFLYQYVTEIPAAEDNVTQFRATGHTSTPLVEKGRMWFTTVRGAVVCLDIGPLERGGGSPREVWKLDMCKDLGVFPSWSLLGYARSCSIAAYRDFLYVLSGNGVDAEDRVPAPKAPSLICLHKTTGKVIWSDNSPGKNIREGQYSSLLVIEINGRGQVVAPTGDGWIRSFDVFTGELLWKFDGNPKDIKVPDEWQNWYAAPVFHEGRIYIGNDKNVHNANGRELGWLYCLDPSKKGDISLDLEVVPGKGKPNPNSGVIWRFGGRDERKERRLRGIAASVAIHAGLLIANDSDGYVNCLDAKTGQLHWKHDGRAHLLSSPLIVDEKIYVGTDDGDMLIFALSKEKRLLAKIDLENQPQTSPVFANGVLFQATSNTLYAIAGKDKAPRAKQ